MKEINLNNFKKSSLKLVIDEKEFAINFIPYVIEKEIFANMNSLQEQLLDFWNIPEAEFDKMKEWIIQILSHKKNNTEFDDEIIQEVGVTEIVTIMIKLVEYISDRIILMTNNFQTDEPEKKKIKIEPVIVKE